MALVPFAARYLGEDQYGQYGLASTMMFFVFLFNDLGINTYLTREVAKYPDKAGQFISNTIILKLGLIFINAAVLLLFLWFSGYEKSSQSAILIFAAYGIFTSFVKLGIGIFEAFDRMEYESLILVFEKVIITGLGIYCLLTGRGLFMFCWVFVLGGLLSCFLTFWLVHQKFNKLRLSFDFSFMKDLVKKSLPFGSSMILAQIYNQVGILMLSFLKTEKVLGWYFAAFRLLVQTNIFPTILVTAMFPTLSKAYISSQEKFREWFTKGIKYLLFLALPLVAGTSLLASPIILLVFGAEFANSIPVLKILSWTAGILFFNVYYAGIFKATDRQNILVKIQIFSLVVNVVINFFLIQKYSYIGAAWANLMTEVLILILSSLYIFTKITFINELWFILKSIAATALMVLTILLVADMHVLLIIPICVFIYFACLYLLKGFTFSELLLLKQGE